MRHRSILFALLLLVAAACRDASEPTGPQLKVTDAEIGLPAGSSAALYFVLENTGDQDATLTGVTVSIASMSMLHEVITENGLSTMSPIEGGVDVPAGGTISFEPGGMHGMLMGMAEITEGMEVDVRFDFEGLDSISTTAEVVSLASLSD